MKTVIVDLGFAVGRLSIPDNPEDERQLRSWSLRIIEPSDPSENCYIPASDVEIRAKKNIIVLRDFLNEHIKEEKP